MPKLPTDPPDWDALQAISYEIDLAKQNDKWDRAEFERLMDEGVKAVNGHGEFLEFIVNEADPAWLNALPAKG